MKILAATDFSEDSQKVLDYTAQLVKKCGSKMYVLHLISPCIPQVGAEHAFEMGTLEGYNPMDNYEPLCTDNILASADKRAKVIAHQIKEKWQIPIYGKAEEGSDTANCILDFCTRHKIDMLIIGGNHHSWLSTLLLGSTAEKLIRHATIPITIVPCAIN